MSKIIRNTLITILIGTIITGLGNYMYAWAAFHIFVDTSYYLNPQDNQTVIQLFFYNGGFRTIKELDFAIEDNCNLNWHSPKISGISQECKLKESYQFTGECKKLSVKDGLDIRFKSMGLPPANCSVKLFYEVDWPGLFFRLSSTNILDKSSHPIMYGDEKQKIQQPKVNFTFKLNLIKPFAYRGGRSVIRSFILSNVTQDYTLTGEWFNSSSIYDPSTLIFKEPHAGHFSIPQRGSTVYYHWASIFKNIEEIGFLGTLKDSNKQVFQEKVTIQVIDEGDLIQFLNEDEIIKFDKNSTAFVLDRIEENITTDLSQAKLLLNESRNFLTIPKEISRKLYFNENEVNANITFYDKEGTESEFNSLYVMFLRSIGIPARMKYMIKDDVEYPYTEVYINEKGWIPVDVYDTSHNFGECFINCTDPSQVVIDLR